MGWGVPQYLGIEKRLRRLLRRGGRSREDCEDLIQEALMRLHEYCRSNSVEDEEAFLVRVVRNLSIDWHRRDLRRPVASQSVEDLEALVGFEDERPLPDVIFDAQQRLYLIGKSLDAISRRTRDIYFAHRAGYSYAEISQRLHVSKSTIEKHIARAVLALMDAKERQ
jgi:RNA polymerase sigma factor (sigma-70 family)